MQGFWGHACGLAGMLLGTIPAVAMDVDLAQMTLRELGDVEVTSVSRAPEQLHGAPAAIYVITHDEIERSGATTLVEALRLAPNLQISQLTANQFVAASRGFGGNPQAQNFSNKLLLLIDGRSAYSPLFSGISRDAQNVLLGAGVRVHRYRITNSATPLFEPPRRTLTQWSLSRAWQLALTGSNLLHDSHVESPTPGQAIRRSVVAEDRWSW